MLVVSMVNQKRQRRPNVRLEEIGDFPAAFACDFSPKSRVNVVHKRWKHKSDKFSVVESDDNSPKQELGEIDAVVSTKFSDDLVHNRENKDPNSLKFPLYVSSLNETGMAKSELDFGAITRKCRVMRRRGRSTNGNNRIFAFALGLGHSPSTEDGEEFSGNVMEKTKSNTADDENAFNEINDFSYHENSAASREDSEHNRHSSEACGELNGNDNWNDHDTSSGKHEIAKVDCVADDVTVRGCRGHIHSVGGWLEEQGFGNYVNVFELHEVDEETLPLLTFGDLKEMGIVAVGPRRKLYNAIRHLSDAS